MSKETDNIDSVEMGRLGMQTDPSVCYSLWNEATKEYTDELAVALDISEAFGKITHKSLISILLSYDMPIALLFDISLIEE